MKNKDKKVLIVTGVEDLNYIEYNNSYHELLDITLKSKIKYAQKHNYDLLTLRSFKKDTKNLLDREDNHFGFLRVLNVFEMMDLYDVVMWIDGDALITNDSMSIYDLGVNDEHFFYASWDWMNNLKPYSSGLYKHYFSMGNFIINKTKNLKDFIKCFYENAKFFDEEQCLMNNIYSKTDFKKFMNILDHKFLNGVPQENFEYQEWNDIINRTNFNLPNPWKHSYFLAHVCGIKNENRISLIKKYYKDYI
jgi:hypothetical protein